MQFNDQRMQDLIQDIEAPAWFFTKFHPENTIRERRLDFRIMAEGQS